MFGLAVTSRLAWCGLAALGEAVARAQGSADPAAVWASSAFAPLVRLMHVLSRWDGQLYLDIAQQGYVSPPLHLRAAFFPGLPLALRAMHAAAPRLPLAAAGLLLVHLADAVGWLLLWRLACARVGAARARAVLWAWALFPGRGHSYNLGGESLLVACSLGAFSAAAKGRHALGLLAAALAGTLRLPGAGVGASLALGLVHARLRGRAPRTAWAWAAGYAAAAAAGPLGFAFYLQRTLGQPWAFVQVQAAWRRHPSWPWQSLLSSAEVYDHGAAWLGLAGLWWLVRRGARPGAEGRSVTSLGERYYVALSLALPACTGRLLSMQRFVSVLFPLALAAGCVLPARPAWRRAYAAYGILAGGVLAFKLGYGLKVV